MKLVLLLFAALVLAFAGCGSEEAPVDGDQTDSGQEEDFATSLEMPEIDQWLVIQDSIGVELGDSNLVFGTIVGAQYLPNGNIAVADMMKVQVNIYSSDGQYIRTVGREGQGPGEYQLLSAFSVNTDGSFIVPDAMGGKINFYDPEGNFTHAMTGFFPSPPVSIEAVEGGFVGLKPAWEQNDDEMLTGMEVALWEDSAEASVVYRENLIPFDMNDMGAMAKTMVIFTVDRDEDVFLAEYDTENYLINCVNAAGEEIWTIEEEFPMVRKPLEDIEIERDMVRNRMIAGGAPPAMAEGYEPDEYRSMVAGLSIDNHNRLWVMSGLYEGIVYRVYNADTAEFLFTAALRTTEEKENTMPVITTRGILGYDPTSEDWPRVYLIGPEDPQLFELQDLSETSGQL